MSLCFVNRFLIFLTNVIALCSFCLHHHPPPTSTKAAVADDDEHRAHGDDDALHARLARQLRQAQQTAVQAHGEQGASAAEQAALERKLAAKFAGVLGELRASRLRGVEPALRDGAAESGHERHEHADEATLSDVGAPLHLRETEELFQYAWYNFKGI